MTEKYKPIKGYEGIYEVSNLGNVRSIERKTKVHLFLRTNKGRILKPFLGSGYWKVSLFKDGKQTKYFIHRLVALCFIDNPDNKPEVNHKDFNRLNNSCQNLEWVTSSENILHGYTKQNRRIGGFKLGHKTSVETKIKIGLANRGVWVNFKCDHCGGISKKRETEFSSQSKHFCNKNCYLSFRKRAA